MLGLPFEPRAIGELEPPRLTVYKDLGRTTLDSFEFGTFGAGHADFGVPSNGLQNIVFKAEVVELADTPSKSPKWRVFSKLRVINQVAGKSDTYPPY
jgi:hypothetical protein